MKQRTKREEIIRIFARLLDQWNREKLKDGVCQLLNGEIQTGAFPAVSGRQIRSLSGLG